MSRRRGSRAFWRSRPLKARRPRGSVRPRPAAVRRTRWTRGPPRSLEVLGPIVASAAAAYDVYEVATSDTPVQTGTAKAAGWGGIFVGGESVPRSVRTSDRPGWSSVASSAALLAMRGASAVNKAFGDFSEMAATEAHVNDVIQRSGRVPPDVSGPAAWIMEEATLEDILFGDDE